LAARRAEAGLASKTTASAAMTTSVDRETLLA
jgi:hypothetical protein